MNIESLEKLLDARRVDSYASGHMGSHVLCFERRNEVRLVMKFAPKEDAGAVADIEGNVYGYNQIKALGGSDLVPPELRQLDVTDGKALIMRDLTASMRVANGGYSACVLLWKYFMHTVRKTIVEVDETPNSGLPLFVEEIIAHIKRFSHEGVPQLLELIRKADWTGQWGQPSLMLLDFTPDNLFVSNTRLSFIDPWKQGTYLGHPAVSIGQFSTLMQLYRMKGAQDAARMFKERCLNEMSSLLKCDASAAERAFCLGCTLQYVLSSYTRRVSEPSRSVELTARAQRLWF